MARRPSNTRDLAALAWQAPWVAAQRLTTELAVPDAFGVAMAWQRLALEKYVVGWQVAFAIATSVSRQFAATGSVRVDRLADASLVPVARRVRSNASALRRRAARR